MKKCCVDINRSRNENGVQNIQNGKFDQVLFYVEQVRKMDAYIINTIGVSGLALMQRAGHSAFKIIKKRWPQLCCWVIVCGSGKNGGDGYIVAHLAREAGVRVYVHSLVALDCLKGDTLLACQLYQSRGGDVTTGSLKLTTDTELIVDAILGTGLTRPISGGFKQAIEVINQKSVPVIALDIPSGLHGDSGQALGQSVRADLTISFIALKLGLFIGDASEYTGDIQLCRLNLPDSVMQTQEVKAQLLSKIDMPTRTRTSHKGHCGHVLIIGGDHGFTGAVMLAAEAAARSGAGLVSIATRRTHADLLNLTRPEIMCHGVEDPQELKALLARVSVVAIGPGLGQSKWAEALFDVVYNINLPLIIDADGLNLLAKRSGLLGGHSGVKRSNWVLTPHPGEAVRLLRRDDASLKRNRYPAVLAMQARYGGVCLLKGAGTLVCESGHPVGVNQNGNPGMASGGMGDILTGMIAAFIGQKYTLGDATRMAVYKHGAAADRAVEQGGGERGLLARDLMPYIWEQVNQ